MKFLLTDSGVKNPSIHAALLDLLGKPIEECVALAIPTASYGHPWAKPAGPWRFISGRGGRPGSAAVVRVQPPLYPTGRERYRATIIRDGRAEHSVPAVTAREAVAWAERVALD